MKTDKPKDFNIWIPVTARLPGYNECHFHILVWIYNKDYHRYSVALAQYNGGWYYDGTAIRIKNVTHWMIPQGPEEGENE